MAQLSRRSMLKGTALTALGSLSPFSLSALARAIQTSSTPYQRPKLKITDVRTAQVVVHGPQTHIRIYTDQGIYGQGEATDAAVGTSSLIRGWRRTLIGHDPLNVEAIWETIRTNGIFSGAQAGQYVCALSGVEIALWDLAGKALGLPIYQLLGGKFRDKVQIYCDSDMDVPIGEEADRKLPWIKAQGFKAMKIDLDDATDPARWDSFNWTATNGEIDRMVKWVAHVRESIPAYMALACDMHGRYDAATGKKVAKALEPFRLMWLEEPVPPEDIDAMADIRHSTSTPIACGENLYMRWGYRELLEKAAVDIIQPDFQKVGGLGRSPEGRQHGAGLLRPGCAALRGFADRSHGYCPCMCNVSQLPGMRVALDQSHGPVDQLGQGRRDHRGWLCHSAGPARHWCGDERGSGKEGPDSRNHVVRS